MSYYVDETTEYVLKKTLKKEKFSRILFQFKHIPNLQK